MKRCKKHPRSCKMKHINQRKRVKMSKKKQTNLAKKKNYRAKNRSIIKKGYQANMAMRRLSRKMLQDKHKKNTQEYKLKNIRGKMEKYKLRIYALWYHYFAKKKIELIEKNLFYMHNIEMIKKKKKCLYDAYSRAVKIGLGNTKNNLRRNFRLCNRDLKAKFDKELKIEKMKCKR